MKRLLLVLPVFFLPLLAGCWLNDDDDATLEVSGPTASIRILHASPDAPNVDVFVNDDEVLSDVGYKDASGYLDVPADGFDVAIHAAGTDTSVLDLQDVQLTPDTEYTVIAANVADELEAIQLDDTVTDPASGELAVRVVHAAPQAPIVDVYVTAPDAALADETPAVDDAAFSDASDFLMLPAGDYRIRVTPGDSTDLLFDSGSVSLNEGDKLTIVAVQADENSVSPITLVALTGDAGNPTMEIGDDRGRVRAAHLSPDAPNVDVLVDGEVVLADVAFGSVSDYLPLNSGTYAIEINEAGTTNTVLSESVDVGAGEAYTLAAVDFLTNINTLLTVDDLTAPDEGNAHVRVIHASPDAPNVDVIVDDDTVLTDVPFKAVSDYLPLSAGAHDVMVNVTGTDTTVISVSPDLEDGGIYTVIAADEVANIQPILVQDN